jgi:hypothetical protein
MVSILPSQLMYGTHLQNGRGQGISGKLASSQKNKAPQQQGFDAEFEKAIIFPSC